ncbi:bacteriocin biosynthesis cyclodehydratase domain-containing protein [Agromyces ramosus]|uniref:Bacteriocin biosynthesis cyclodehydratase domain-containing protein n=1 Tax=Agromyces ramosus TaxID=33879 RepID=A0ABU0R424_9MICO|nr:bacteriocin biosynthesis cyclodehydratase domain-containing protein [Agromyces ramosus]
MAPRIDPNLPLVWRTPNELQLGAAVPRVVLTDPGELETGLIAALRHGASLSTLQTIGGGLGGSPEAVTRLLDTLAPAFEASAGRADAATSVQHGRRPLVALDADDSTSERIAANLAALGYAIASARDAFIDGVPAPGVGLVVIAAAWVIAPARHLPWLRHDVPHLAIVFDDTGARVGPLVEPGVGPCLRCLDLSRRDHDAAWPVIAAQLASRPAASRTARAVLDAAGVAASVVDDRLAHDVTALASASITLAGQGAPPQRRAHRPHPECGCRAPGGSATAPARLDAHRDVPSSVRVAAVPA